jgi:hypothetical protein
VSFEVCEAEDAEKSFDSDPSRGIPLLLSINPTSR